MLTSLFRFVNKIFIVLIHISNGALKPLNRLQYVYIYEYRLLFNNWDILQVWRDVKIFYVL